MKMFRMIVPENRVYAESAIIMMAADKLVENARGDESACNAVWFKHTERLNVNEAMSVLSRSGVEFDRTEVRA